jgi:hypothetical protein
MEVALSTAHSMHDLPPPLVEVVIEGSDAP